MNDTIVEYLASYGSSINYEDLPAEVIQRVKILLMDTLACAVGGYTSEPCKIARRLAKRIERCDMPTSIWGSSHKSSPELATFANGVMIRYLDFNDSYFSNEGGHPSDSLAAILSCADAVQEPQAVLAQLRIVRVDGDVVEESIDRRAQFRHRRHGGGEIFAGDG